MSFLEEDQNVAHYGHLFGGITGLLMTLFIFKSPKTYRFERIVRAAALTLLICITLFFVYNHIFRSNKFGNPEVLETLCLAENLRELFQQHHDDEN